MSELIITERSNLVAIADAVRQNLNTTGEITINEIISGVNDIAASGGSTDIEDGLITGTLTEYTNDRVESVSACFRANSNIKTVNFPKATMVASNAFNLSTIESINLPSTTTFGDSVFYRCSSLSSVSLPRLTTTGSYTFRESSVVEIDLPSLETEGGWLCYNCNNLETANLPSLTNAGGATFNGCSSLTSVNVPLLTTIPAQTFSYCSALRFIDLPLATSIANYAFAGCSIKTLILRFNGVCTLGGTQNEFSAVYVPRALIESYQTATNWSTLYAAGTCTFLALEDYTVDGTTTGDLDWDKINGGA